MSIPRGHTEIRYNNDRPVARYMNNVYPVEQMAVGDFFLAYPRKHQSFGSLRCAIMVEVNYCRDDDRRFALLQEKDPATGKVVALRCVCCEPRSQVYQAPRPVAKRARKRICPVCARQMVCPKCGPVR